MVEFFCYIDDAKNLCPRKFMMMKSKLLLLMLHKISHALIKKITKLRVLYKNLKGKN